jgi:hypothetical protein
MTLEAIVLLGKRLGGIFVDGGVSRAEQAGDQYKSDAGDKLFFHDFLSD